MLIFAILSLLYVSRCTGVILSHTFELDLCLSIQQEVQITSLDVTTFILIYASVVRVS